MFYRAGLGPVSIDDAVGELEHFKAAGGDCVLDADSDRPGPEAVHRFKKSRPEQAFKL